MVPTMDYARNMFDAMPEREVFLWNTLIRGNADRGACHEAIVLYRKISLVSMYAKNGETLNSELVFNEMVVKNIVSWTAMTAAYVKNGFYKEGLSLLQDMVASGSQPNVGYTVGVDSSMSLMNALIAFYGECRNLETARSLFDGMVVRNQVSWNAMIAAYEQNNAGTEAI
ncbi:putative pentatricopeptide [Rosa chinensis]|uniref:Putative pentatricopeptide n=1 Tax=Rosa chinensis TaxID=74649 RepID=A0A2P6QG76_ROSCH|nr:putative pentatricopeptide [Rosa chinensis]